MEIFSEVNYEKVTKEGLVVTTKDGTKKALKADSIITALPLLPNTNLAESMKGMAKEVYIMGDADKPAFIMDAVTTVARIAREF